MRVIVIILLLLITLRQYRKYHELLCPAVAVNIMWIISITCTTLLIPGFDFNVETGMTLIFGAVLFQVGFAITSKGYCIDEISYRIRPNMLKLLVLALLPIFVISLKSLYESMENNVMYDVLTKDREETESIGGYFAKIIQYISILFIILCNRSENKIIRKQIMPYVIILCAMGFITAIMNATRNGMLFYFLPFVVALLYSLNVPYKKQIQYLSMGAGVFLVYYAYISFNKYAWMYNSANTNEVLYSELTDYLSGSLIAFDNAINTHAYTRMGAGCFRFFFAVYDSLFGTKLAVPLVNDFESAYGVETNVFTFYDFYLRDFGVCFAVFMQFIVACIHGTMYRRKKTVIGLYLFSMLTYPLIMQFFQDQYFSLLSTWLQIIIVAFVLLRTGLFVNRTKNGKATT